MKKPLIVLSLVIILCMGFTFVAQGDPGDGTITMPTVPIPTHTTACDHVAAEPVTENKVASTCTADGHYDAVIYCSKCGAELSRTENIVIPAFGHVLGKWETAEGGVAATCTQSGTTAGEVRRCVNCDYFETRGEGEEIAALGHDYVAGTPVAPSCTEDGYTLYTCSRCGDSYRDEVVTAPGHDWDDGVVTKEPTATEEGIKTFTCSRCHTTRTEPIEPTGTTLPEGSTDYEASDIPFSGGYDIRSYSISNIAVGSARACQLNVSWNILSVRVSGYQIQYSTSSAFASAATKTVTVKGGAQQAAVIQRMPQGKKVYVRVRAYYTDKSGTAYSKWSVTKSTTILKK